MPATLNQIEIVGFTGEITSIDKVIIPKGAATVAHNVDVQNGQIKVRKGHTLLSAAPAGFSAQLGFKYVAGYSDSYVYAEEIISIEARSGPIYRPYSINTTNGTRTEIKDGTTSQTLTNAPWHILSHQGYAYCFSRGGLAYRHIVGDATSWEAVDVAAPSDLTGNVPITGEQTEDLSSVVDGATESFATLVSGDLSNLVNTTFNSVVGTGFTMDKTATGACELEADLPSNPTDLSAVDGFRFTLTIPGQPDPTQGPFGAAYLSRFINVSLIDATANTQAMEVTWNHNKTTGVFEVEARFPEGTAAEFADTESVLIAFEQFFYVGGLQQTYTYTISQLTYFADDAGSTPTVSGDAERVRFGIAAFNSERGAESESVLPSDWHKIDSTPTRWFSNGDTYLGNQVSVSIPTPSSPADNIRLYVMFEEENVWRLVDTIDEPGDYEVTLNSTQLHALPERFVLEINPVGNVTCAVAHGGSIVWGGEGGKENIRISAIGNPPNIASDTDDLDDQTRGATFSMADNFGDEPVAMLSVADGLYIFGSKGVYAMQGKIPVQMTPPKRFPDGLGIIGANACSVFVDQGGNPAVLYIDTKQQLWILQIVNGLSEFGLRATRFDRKIEGLIRSWLTQTDSPTLDDIAIVHDKANDSVHFCYGTRMIVLSRRNLIEDQRQFVRHGYSATWKLYTAETEKLWAVNSTGQVHQLQNGTTDNGTAISDAYFEMGDMAGEYRRIARVAVEREDDTKAVAVQVVSTSTPGGTTTNSASIAASTRFGRFPVAQVGHRHRVRISLTDPLAVVSRIILDEHGPLSRRLQT